MFLGYSSSYLDYRCHDLSSNCIYISRHVRFHEQYFPFLESNQVSTSDHSMSTSTLTSNIPFLTTFLIPNFSKPRTSPTYPSVLLSPPAFVSLNHSTGLGFVIPALSLSDSLIIVASLVSLLGPSPPLNTSDQSPQGLDLCVDLSSYSISYQT